jgi:hypothetical protein
VEDDVDILGQPRVGHEKPTHFTLGVEMSKRDIAVEGLKTLLLFGQFAAITITWFFLGV